MNVGMIKPTNTDGYSPEVVVGAVVVVVVGAVVVVVVGALVVVVVVGVGAVVVGGAVAGLVQATLQPLAPRPIFWLSVMNSTMKSEEDLNTNFFFLPQTLKKEKLEKLTKAEKTYNFSSSSFARNRLSPLLHSSLSSFVMKILLQEKVISAQVSSIR